jgi:hypothetical protein
VGATIVVASESSCRIGIQLLDTLPQSGQHTTASDVNRADRHAQFWRDLGRLPAFYGGPPKRLPGLQRELAAHVVGRPLE